MRVNFIPPSPANRVLEGGMCTLLQRRRSGSVPQSAHHKPVHELTRAMKSTRIGHDLRPPGRVPTGSCFATCPASR